MAVCSSCGRNTLKYVKFQCPGENCTETIIRCEDCRKTGNAYVCSSCGFEGP
ncbi:MAG: zinc finger domain-containing protein [Candidatus Marsarchaeota archaeon]|nr:zinc finger domain-containing protein [Candidatus Marsarchaeota archaeon]